MKISTIEESLEILQDNYLDEVAKLADEVFTLEIEPYFKKNNITMKTGRGWGTVLWKNGDVISSDMLPEKIRDILYMEVDRDSYLVNYMKDYNGEPK